VKVKMLSWNLDNYVRKTQLDLQIVPRNYDPTLHPFEVLQEYVRVLNATKLEGVFAKPFLHPKSLATVLSGEYVLAFVGLLFTVGDDKTVKQWKMDGPGYREEEEAITYNIRKDTGIDHHWKEAVFATCGQQLDIWGEQRTNPICSMTWRFDSISSVVKYLVFLTILMYNYLLLLT
uniref:Uncharacterized protein n=1 Tax=Piliocolobus tephrosceles TaxID=591936 RepID=A0A8C9JA37_9PRIM